MEHRLQPILHGWTVLESMVKGMPVQGRYQKCIQSRLIATFALRATAHSCGCVAAAGGAAAAAAAAAPVHPCRLNSCSAPILSGYLKELTLVSIERVEALRAQR